MLKIKTPQQKKKESYAHDRVEGYGCPHSARRNRPLDKALGRREFRRTSKQLLASLPEEVLQLPPERTRWTAFKSGMPLPEHLEDTQRQRMQRESHRLFRKGYSEKTHDRFRRVVQSWMQGHTDRSALLADFYFGLLNYFPAEPLGGRLSYPTHRIFLGKFFANEPELKRNFENWITLVRDNQIRIDW